MKRFLLLTVLVSVLVSCSAKKQIESAISNGNYDHAITEALQKLESNKEKKRKQDYIVMLENAYYKVLEEDLQTIAHLKKDGNPEHYKAIYELYIDLEARQNAIKRALPLQINGKSLNLEFNDYTSEIVDYRYKTSDYLIGQGITLLDSNDKFNARKAHRIFNNIERLNPNFEETRSLIAESHQKGTDYIHISVANQTQQVIPQQLESELIDFNTYGFDQYWTKYHSSTIDTINYDFAIELQLKQINISPERINERQQLRERQIVDGWEYQLDTNQNVMKDSLGNDIKIDKIVNVKARFTEVLQTKSANVIADVVFTDLKQNQVIDILNMDSSFVFENIFARFRGDERALTKNDRSLLNQSHIRFPSNEQMVYSASEDLKLKLKAMIKTYRFDS